MKGMRQESTKRTHGKKFEYGAFMDPDFM